MTVFSKRDHFAHKIKNDFFTFPGRANLGLLIDTWPTEGTHTQRVHSNAPLMGG